MGETRAGCLGVTYKYIVIEGDGSNPFGWDANKRGKEIVAGDTELAKDLYDFTATRHRKAVYLGRLGSGDLFNKEADRILWINGKFGVLSEDMESIGTYAAAKELGVPCIGVRIISNNELLNEGLDKTQSVEIQKLLTEYLNSATMHRTAPSRT